MVIQKMFKRIIIFGGTGSGKTTLARALSSKTGIPYYTTDYMVYKQIGKQKYSEKERDKILKAIIQKQKWIIEGVHAREWILPAVSKAEFVILIDLNKLTLFKRVTLRYFREKKVHYQNLRDLFKMIYWANIYKKDSLILHKNHIDYFKKKHIILKSIKEVTKFLDNYRPKGLKS